MITTKKNHPLGNHDCYHLLQTLWTLKLDDFVQVCVPNLLAA